MKITIDGSGRVVVQKKMRDQLNISAGDQLELEVDSGGVHLKKLFSKSTLIRKKAVWVHHGVGNSARDIADYINSERELRSIDAAGRTKKS